MKKALLTAALLLSVPTASVNASTDAPVTVSCDPFENLAIYLNQLFDPAELAEVIKNESGVQNQELVELIIKQVDAVQVAISEFKKSFSADEVTKIIEFHTSDVGIKFETLLPSIIENYQAALLEKIKATQKTMVNVILKQDMDK